MIWDYSKQIFKCLMLLDDNVTAQQQLQLMYNMAALYEKPVDVETLCAYYAVMKNNGWIMPYTVNGRQLSMSEIADVVKNMAPTVSAGSCTELFSRCAQSDNALEVCKQCPLSKNYCNARISDEITVMSYILSFGGTSIIDLKSLGIDDLRGCLHSVEFIPYGKKKGCYGFVHNLLGEIAELAIRYSFLCTDVDTFWQTAKPILHTKLKKRHSVSDSESDKYCRDFVYSLWRDKSDFDYSRVDIPAIVSRITKPYDYAPPIPENSCGHSDNATVMSEKTAAPSAPVMSDVATPLQSNNNMYGKMSGTTLEDLETSNIDGLLDIIGLNLLPPADNSCSSPIPVNESGLKKDSPSNVDGSYNATNDTDLPDSQLNCEILNEDLLFSEIDAALLPANLPDAPPDTSSVSVNSEKDAGPAPVISASIVTPEDNTQSDQEAEKGVHEDTLMHPVPAGGNFEPVKDNAVLDSEYVSFTVRDGYSRSGVSIIDDIEAVYCPTLRNDDDFLRLEKRLATAKIVPCELVSYKGNIGILMYLSQEYYYVRYNTDCFGMLHTLFNSESVLKIVLNMFQMAQYVYMYDKVFNKVYSLQELYRVTSCAFKEKVADLVTDCDLSDRLYLIKLLPHYEELFNLVYESVRNSEALKDSATMVSSSTIMHALSSDLSKYLKSSLQFTDEGYVYESVAGVNIGGMLIDISDIYISAECKVSSPLNRIIMCSFRRLIGSGYVYKYSLKIVAVHKTGVQLYVPCNKDMYELLDILLRVFSASIHYVTKDSPRFSCTPRILRATDMLSD